VAGGDTSSDSVAMVLGTISRDAAKHNLKKVGIQATINNYMTIIDAQEDQVLLKTYSLRFFDQLLKPFLKSLP